MKKLHANILLVIIKILLDSTAEYINGKSEISGIIPLSGLNCVTIIIGLFNRSSGKPVIGVMNQPFHSYVNGRYISYDIFISILLLFL